MKSTEQFIPVLVTETYYTNYHLNRVAKGIQSAARRKKLSVRMSSVLEEIISWCKEQDLPSCIVLCYSLADAAEYAKAFYNANIHPIFTNMQPDSPYPYSCVTQDYFDICDRVVEAIADMHGKVAYLGKNPDSYTDAMRYKEIRLALCGHSLDCDVYNNSGDVNACIQSFLPHVEEYAAVICANDNIAVLLSRKLEHPEKYNIMSFGGLVISGHVNGITSVEMDYFSVGEHSVEVFSLVCKNDGIRSIIMTVADMRQDGHSRRISAAEKEQEVRIDFFDDAEVRRTTALENLLANCDEVDREILGGLLRGESYSTIEENSYISLHTIKYRINKMIDHAQVADKNELLALLRSYEICF